jgi:N-acetylglucosaminyldiphosphoundecaprenol N-acetyl-beta-D-mannosaminyltransferase
MKKDTFFNIGINLITTPEGLETTKEYLNTEGCKTIFFLNAHCYNIAQKNIAYLNALNNADMVLNDGIGIKLGSFLYGLTIRENMNGTDFIPKIISLCVRENKSIYLLGAKEGISDMVVDSLKNKFPEIKIVGNRSGYFAPEEEEELIQDINNSGADLLIVGMGVPTQELWINNNKNKFNSVKIAVAGGAIIDFMSGRVLRAPRWIQFIGMEWFFRFMQEPTRLFKRYFKGNFVFFWHVLRHIRTTRINRI